MLQFTPLAAVAQLDRVLGYEPRGRGFESCQPRHIRNCLEKSGLFLLWDRNGNTRRATPVFVSDEQSIYP
jgi:hypothetical protein